MRCPTSPVAHVDGLEISVHGAVDDEIAEDFWALYRTTFGELATRAVARQVLHRHEFLEEMRDPRVSKYVARDAQTGAVVGLSTLTRDLTTVPWVSPEYFAHHYPEHTARDAVFYLGFTLVHPQRRRSRTFYLMTRHVIEVVVEAHGVCGWDVCAYNDRVLGFPANIEAMLNRHADATIAPVDTQTYFVASTNGPLPGGAEPGVVAG